MKSWKRLLPVLAVILVMFGISLGEILSNAGKIAINNDFKLPSWPKETVDRFARMPVQEDGRIKPLDGCSACGGSSESNRPWSASGYIGGGGIGLFEVGATLADAIRGGGTADQIGARVGKTLDRRHHLSIRRTHYRAALRRHQEIAGSAAWVCE